MSDGENTLWQASLDKETATVTLAGEIDFSNSLAVRDWLKDACARTTGELRLGLAGLSYIDSSGLAILIEIRKFLKAKDRSVRIVNVSSQVQKLFSLTQIGELFGI